jgi:hypothetical protein
VEFHPQQELLYFLQQVTMLDLGLVAQLMLPIESKNTLMCPSARSRTFFVVY